ncbi:glycosyltransferase family 2 protein [Butyrivibrio sp. VCD2006]|uniref:glycosyltransferase family 2 protein n=1 Tax=Butyrivibrio sp. VCD2006 TaxID=1280664 RepID=UPI0004274BE0|nr:glycosyltransferase family 2 protein [Butyrivibrio sp. VCD2006]
MNKVLTISIAAYNVKKTLNRTVESVLKAKNVENIEIIIVNDGSTDGTDIVARELNTQYPGIIIAIDKENGGYGSTINTALKISSGKYFKLLDGDDYFDPKELEEFVDYLASIDDDLVFTPFKECYLDGKERIIKKDRANGLQIDISSLAENFTMHSVTYKKEVLLNSGLVLPNKCLYTDNLFCLIPLNCVKTIRYVDFTVYQYVLGSEEQSVSRKNKIRHLSDLELVVDYALDFIKDTPIEKEAERAIITKMGFIYYAYIDTALLCPISNDVKKKLVFYERKVKETNRGVYDSLKNRKVMMLLRKSRYFLYPLASVLRKCMGD